MKPFLTIGVAGHHRHGKTALVHGLSGLDSTSLYLREEVPLTIETGVVPLELPSGLHVALIDVPGHERYFKNTLRGLACIDLVILVVAADEGVTEQTREHMDIVRLNGCQNGVMVLSKTDLVDEEMVQLVKEELQSTVRDTFLDGRAVIPLSNMTGQGLDTLVATLESACIKTKKRDTETPFRMYVDHVYDGKNGAIVSGTVLSGHLSKGETVQVLPVGHDGKVRSLEVHHEMVQKVYAGQRAGVAVDAVDPNELRRGVVLAEKGLLESSCFLNGPLQYLSKNTASLENRSPVRVYTGTDTTNAFVVMMEGDHIDPGDEAMVQLRLMDRLSPAIGDSCLICRLDKPSIIGVVSVYDKREIKSRKAVKESLCFFQAIKEKDIPGAIEGLLSCHDEQPITEKTILRKTLFTHHDVKKALSILLNEGRIIPMDQNAFFSKRIFQELQTRLPTVIKNMHALLPDQGALDTHDVHRQFSRELDPMIFRALLMHLEKKGQIQWTGGNLQYRGPKQILTKKQRQRISAILRFAEDSGFSPFTLHAVWKAQGPGPTRQEMIHLLRYLCSRNTLVHIQDSRYLASGKYEESRFLDNEHLNRIKAKITRYSKKAEALTLAEAKKLLGVSRTSAVRILEHLDAVGFTMRRGNARVVRKEPSPKNTTSSPMGFQVQQVSPV